MGEVSKTRSDESLTSFSSASLPCVQSLSSTRSLSVALEPSLLRGVPLHQALSRWGRHWVSSEATHAYELSRQTARLDNFLSHDWHTSGWKKFLALLVLFNSRAAAIASTGMTMLLAILQSTSIVPDGVWVTCSGYATFALVFLFWQRLRALVRPRVVFLDKLCIAQHDPMLKERAILGLAAFLDSSDNLTVLWSPVYFRRLWCSYEMAAFFRHADKARGRPVTVMPVTSAILLCVLAGQFWIMTIGEYLVLRDLEVGGSVGESFWRNVVIIGALTTGIAGALVPVTLYIGIQLMDDLQKLPQQLQGFRVQDSLSSCCSWQHVRPDTGERIPCDRALVFAMLRKWYGRSGRAAGFGEEHLDAFNDFVTNRLAPSVLKTVGFGNFPVAYAFCLSSSANVPWLAASVGQLARGPAPDASGADVLLWAVRVLLNVTFLIMMGMFISRFSFSISWLGHHLVHHGHCRWKLCLTMVLSQVSVAFVGSLWAAFRTSMYWRQDSWLPILPFLVLMGCTVGLFAQGWRVPSTPSTGAGEISEVEDRRPRMSDVPVSAAESQEFFTVSPRDLITVSF